MDPITAEDVDALYKNAQVLARRAYDAKVRAVKVKHALDDAIRKVSGEALEWGAAPDAIQKIVMEKTAKDRQLAEECANLANAAIADLEAMHYDLDRTRLIVQILTR